MATSLKERQALHHGFASKLHHLLLLSAALLLWSNVRAAVTAPIYPVSVLTYHNDNFRTGQNTNEAILTPANVGSTNFAKLFALTVDGALFAEPLVMANVTMPGRGIHNVIFIATEHDSVYAFDADSTNGANSTNFWHVSFINPAAGITTVPKGDTGSSEITPEIGITSTPVIDPLSGTLYVESKIKTSNSVPPFATNYFHYLHALDITTGAEKFGGPVLIDATILGDGDGSSGGSLAFNALRHLNRCALCLSGGVVYVAYASLGDKVPYHGWLFGYDAHTLAQTYLYNSNPNGSDSGFWESGCGPAADTNGFLYVSTGNGSFDGATNLDYGDSLLKLSTSNSLSLVDSFTPHDQDALNTNDLDFGSGGMILLPDEVGNTTNRHLLVSAAKQGTIYLVNRDNLGGFNTPVDLVVDEIPSNILKCWDSPAYFDHNIYYVGASDTLKAFNITNGVIGPNIVSNTLIFGSTGASPTVSANGTSNGIVWAIDVPHKSLNYYFATNVAIEIGTTQALPTSVKFAVATIANGKVYVGTTNQAIVFGLKTPTITTQPTSVRVIPGTNAIFTVTATSTATPLRYQWFKNSVAILNQTNASLTVTNVQVTDGGAYSAVVSDNVGTALSVIAALDVTGITENMDGTVTVAFNGNPGQAYHIEAATNLTPPISWQVLPGSTTNAPPAGLWQFIDSNAPSYPARFYRSASP